MQVKTCLEEQATLVRYHRVNPLLQSFWSSRLVALKWIVYNHMRSEEFFQFWLWKNWWFFYDSECYIFMVKNWIRNDSLKWYLLKLTVSLIISYFLFEFQLRWALIFLKMGWERHLVSILLELRLQNWIYTYFCLYLIDKCCRLLFCSAHQVMD